MRSVDCILKAAVSAGAAKVVDSFYAPSRLPCLRPMRQRTTHQSRLSRRHSCYWVVMSFHIARFGRQLVFAVDGWACRPAVAAAHAPWHGCYLYATALLGIGRGSSTPVINSTIINRAFTSISNAP